jgi:hypothetical protein
MKTKAAVAFVLFLSGVLCAFNHPEIKWKSVTTSHFIIHYYDRTEPAVYAAWKIAEESYAALSELYDYTEREKINLALADYDDYSNGYASWTNGSIMIWVTDSRFDLRGNNTWLRNVITHELSHIVTLEKSSKMQLFDWTFELDYQSPAADISLTEPFATTRFWPNWLAEGAAQLESARRGNDCWDSRRDMLLSDAVANGAELTLDAMGYFNHTSIRSELVYNQGFSFLKYIEGRIGTQALVRMWNAGRNSALFMSNFRSFFTDQTGLRLQDLYDQWLDSVRTAARQRAPTNPTPTATVWNKGTYNYLPKVSGDGTWWGWLTSNKDDFGRTDLVIAPYGKTTGGITIQWALSSWDFSADSRRVFYLKARELSDHGSAFNDLYVFDLASRTDRRLTRNGRFYDIAVSPDNTQIACVQFRDGAYSVRVAAADCRNWETLVAGKVGEPFMGLSFSPVKLSLLQPSATPAPARDTVTGQRAADSTKKDASAAKTAADADASVPVEPPEYKIVTSRLINGRARICVIGLSSKTLKVVGPDFGQQEFPHWGRDGRIYFDADYDGIFNIYSMRPDGSDLRRHTSVGGGMFEPFLDNNGNLLCLQFSRQAFSVVTCPAGGAPYALPQSFACSFSAVPSPKGEVTIKSRPYEGRLLRPVWELQSLLSVDDQTGTFIDAVQHGRFAGWSDTAAIEAGTGIMMSRADALDKKEMSMGLMAAVVHQGAVLPDSLTKNTVNAVGDRIAPKAARQDFLASFTDKKLREISGMEPTHGTSIAPFISNFAGRKNLVNAVAAQGDPAGDSTSGLLSSWIPVLFPSFQLVNSMSAVTFTLDAQAALAYFIPAELSVGGEASWQASRDWYFGIAPQLDLYPVPTFSLTEFKVPIYAIWFTYGYQNEDIAYNESGVSEFSLSTTPDFFASVDSVDTSNVSYPRSTAVTYELQFFHGFPVSTHSSIIVSTDDYYTHLSSDNFVDPRGLLKGLSSEYINLSAGASFVFPLWRQINRGPAYADALYGQVGYEYSFYANTLKIKGQVSKAFLDRAFTDDYIYPSHILTVGTQLGFFKSYEFSRTLVARIAWDIMRNKVGLNLTVGF